MNPKSKASFASTSPDVYTAAGETFRNHEKGKSQTKCPSCCTNRADVPSSVSRPMAGNCEEENRNNHMLTLVPDDAGRAFPSVPEPATPESSIQNVAKVVPSEHDDSVSSEPVSSFSVSPEAVLDVSRASDTVCGVSVPDNPGFTEPNSEATPPFESDCHSPIPPEQVLVAPVLTDLGVPVPVAPILSEPSHGALILNPGLGPSTRNAIINTYNISVTNNSYGETSSLLPPLSTQEWKVSYENCDQIAKHLDLFEGWKLLASKLQFDKAINWVEQWARNTNKSPTVLLLEKWMEQNTGNNETCFRCLLDALRSMCRNDIADELEDFEYEIVRL